MADGGNVTGIAQKILPYTTIALIIAVLYVAWVFYSRRRDQRAAEEALAAKKAAQNQKVVDTYFGSGDVKLLQFSVGPIHLRRGDKANMCYGVSNAVSITIEPHVEDTKPSYNHCFQIAPRQTTTYTLTAKDAKGHTETGSLTVHVQ